MKILHVITSMHTGGAEHLLVDLLPQVRALGADVELLLFDGTRTPFRTQIEQAGIKVHHLTVGGNVYNPLNILRLRRFLKGYDIVHTHNTACQLFASIARYITAGGAKLVTTEHSANNRRRGKWYLKPVDRIMYRKYDCIACISDQARENLTTHLGNDRNVTVVLNGVDTSRFIAPIDDIGGKANFVITMVASLSAAKDQDTVIRAIAELPREYRFQMVGDGPRRSDIEALIAELGVGDRVSLLGIRTDIADILHSSDVTILSSHWEGLSLSSIEGMASGRPFIASDVDGLREVVKGYGILFPHGNHKALAQEIKRLCSEPEHYRAVAEACQTRALQFDISTTARNYFDIYQNLLNQ